jgi:hypothetical protein
MREFLRTNKQLRFISSRRYEEIHIVCYSQHIVGPVMNEFYMNLYAHVAFPPWAKVTDWKEFEQRVLRRTWPLWTWERWAGRNCTSRIPWRVTYCCCNVTAAVTRERRAAQCSKDGENEKGKQTSSERLNGRGLRTGSNGELLHTRWCRFWFQQNWEFLDQRDNYQESPIS